MWQNKQLKGSIDFLMWSYFNLTLDDGDNLDRILSASLHRAYLDATQQGAYNTLIPKTEKALKDASDKVGSSVGKKLRDRVLMLLKGDAEEFETWHKETCNKVKKAYEGVSRNGDELFSYGNAQKWVNMTLKYIYLLYGLYHAFSPECCFCRKYGSAIEKHSKEFHAPADSFIIEALDLKEVGAWSKWNDRDYARYQEDLKGTIQSGKNQLEWEGLNWIKIARGRKKGRFKELESMYKSEN